MEATLKLGNFQELTHDELMLVDGGSWRDVFDAGAGVVLIGAGIVVACIPGGQAAGAKAIGGGALMVSNVFFR